MGRHTTRAGTQCSPCGASWGGCSLGVGAPCSSPPASRHRTSSSGPSLLGLLPGVWGELLFIQAQTQRQGKGEERERHSLRLRGVPRPAQVPCSLLLPLAVPRVGGACLLVWVGMGISVCLSGREECAFAKSQSLALLAQGEVLRGIVGCWVLPSPAAFGKGERKIRSSPTHTLNHC